MKKQKTIILAIAALATLTACDSGDAPLQHADSYDYITFAAQPQRLLTRTNPYEAYDTQRHPATMGTFGYYDLASATDMSTSANCIFNNETTTYTAATAEWTTATRKLWSDYAKATSFDFFAYMPQAASATLTRTAPSAYTLTLPFTMTVAQSSSDGVSSSDGTSMPVAPTPVILDTKAAPIICALPEHKEGKTASDGDFTFDRVINMQFDQTLTGYRLLFQLDPTMGAIRQFRIKSVTLSGQLATSGTVSRSYSWSDSKKEWTADGIQWTGINRQSFDDSPFAIPYKNNTAANDNNTTFFDDDTKTAVVTNDDYTQWGPDFYTIPDAQFRPVISVTYDAELKAEDGTTVVSRKDITSTITLNKEKFSSLTTGKIAFITPIRILIQPRYLYVLADDDAYAGHLLIK